MNTLDLVIRLNSVHCFKSGEERTAEPYLWAAFFKLDGDSVFVNTAAGGIKLEGSATVYGTQGFQSNLFQRSARSGDTLPIPASIGEWRTKLRPIPIRPPFGILKEVSAICGCLVVLMEEDNTPNSAVEAGYQQLVASLRKALNDLIPSFGLGSAEPTEQQLNELTAKIKTDVEKAIKDNIDVLGLVGLIFTGFDIDDVIGDYLGLFRAHEIEHAGAAKMPIVKRWTDKVKVPLPPVGPGGAGAIAYQEVDRDWQLTGTVVGLPVASDEQPGILRIVTPAVATYTHGGVERMYAFVPDNNGRLRCHFGNGASWQWADQGAPSNGIKLVSAAAAVRAVGASGAMQPAPRLYAYVRGDDGGLYENFWDRTQWHWAMHGRPPNGQLIATSPVAHVFQKDLPGSGLPNAVDNIYVGVGTSDGHLWVRVWGRPAAGGHFQWQWLDHGRPASAAGIPTTLASEPAITTYRVDGKQRIYIFVRGADGHLYERYWDGAPNLFDTNLADGHWHWVDHAQPKSGVTVASAPAIQMYSNDPKRAFCVFVVGSDGGLYLRRWDNQAGSWVWDDLQKPGDFPAMKGRPSSVYFRHDNTPRMYVYLQGTDDRIYLCFWDTQQWQWRKSEAEAPRPMASGADTLAFRLNGHQKMHSYWVGDNGKLYTYFWDAERQVWSWMPLGSP